jgi:hypothetical protein
MNSLPFTDRQPLEPTGRRAEASTEEQLTGRHA